MNITTRWSMKTLGIKRLTAHRERCYKLVSLLHLRGDNYVYAALAVVPGHRHELPVLYQLVEDFVRHAGPGVLKQLPSGSSGNSISPTTSSSSIWATPICSCRW